MNLTLIIIVIGILFFIFDILDRCGLGQSKRKKFEEGFENLTGNVLDDNALDAINYGEQINKDAYDYYRLGTTYLVNAEDPARAIVHYDNAIQALGEGNFDPDDFDHVVDRIGDYIPIIEEYNVNNIGDLENLDNLRFNINNVIIDELKETMETKQKERKQKEIKQKSDVPQYLEAKQQWHSDSQNVHDSNVSNELMVQFNKLREDNIGDNRTESYLEFQQWAIPQLSRDEQGVLNRMNENGLVPALRYKGVNVREQEYLQEIWRRIHHSSNEKNREELKKSLLEQVKSCYENGSIVCPDGRNTRIMSSLAKLDFNPRMGILKTKEVIRNELLHKLSESAKYITNNLDEDELDQYNKGEETPKIKKLIEHVKQDMNNIGHEYKGKLKQDQIDRLIAESQSVL